MRHIIKLPPKMSYYEADGLKVLDIRATRVNVIPRVLKGVDIVLAKQAQIEYVAPDYRGHLVETITSWSKGAQPETVYAANEKIAILKKSFIQKEQFGPDFFETPYSARHICSGYPDEEMHLPSKLSFHWNPQERIGSLNAGKTWLLERPVIQNISEVIMPNLDKMQRRLKQEALEKRKIKHRDQRKDHSMIVFITGGMYRR